MGRLSRNLIAVAISLGIHTLLLAAVFLQLDRRPHPEGPLPPISVGVLLPATVPPASPGPITDTAGRRPEESSQASPDPNTVSNNPGSGIGESLAVPPWQIDTPPRMVRPGDAPGNADVNPILDAMPLTASVFLNDSGRPYLIIYEPWPGETARSWLNSYFLTAVFSPGLVGSSPVPSRLDIPMRLQGMEGR